MADWDVKCGNMSCEGLVVNSLPCSFGDTSQQTVYPFLLGGGACAELIAGLDWEGSTLGPLDRWSPILRATLSNLLCSPVPMALFWGPEGILLYNDGYAALAAGRHPALMGRPLHEGWPELVAFPEDVLRKVLSGSARSYKDAELTAYRRGREEQAFFNLDYSPVRGEDGRPAGVLALLVETTAAVLGARALREAEVQTRIDAERMQLALDAGAVLGTWDWDLVTNRFVADERYARSFGLDPTACREGLSTEEVIGIVPPEDRPVLQAAVAQALTRGGSYSH